MPEAAGPEAHDTRLRSQPLAAVGGATGVLSDWREVNDAEAPTSDTPAKRHKPNKTQRKKAQAARVTDTGALIADIDAVRQASWLLELGRGGAAPRLQALRLGIAAQAKLAVKAAQARVEAVAVAPAANDAEGRASATEVACAKATAAARYGEADLARASEAKCDHDLRAMLRELKAAVAEAQA